MISGIKQQETGTGGLRNTLETVVWYTPFMRDEITTTGPLELSREMSYDIINSWSNEKKRQYFSESDLDIFVFDGYIDLDRDRITVPQKVVDSFIRTEYGASIVAQDLIQSNSRVLEVVFNQAGYTAPAIGTPQRTIYDGTAYNTGAVRPIAAGIQYSMEQVGVRLPELNINVGYSEYEGTIDGFLGSQTQSAFTQWARTNNVGLTDAQIARDFSRGVSSFVGSPSWQALNSAYQSQYGTNAPLLVPVEVITSSSDYKVDNYGLRVYTTVNS